MINFQVAMIKYQKSTEKRQSSLFKNSKARIYDYEVFPADDRRQFSLISADLKVYEVQILHQLILLKSAVFFFVNLREMNTNYKILSQNQ